MQIVLWVLLQQPGHGLRNPDRARHGARFHVFAFEDGDQSIAHKLVDVTAMVFDNIGLNIEILVQQMGRDPRPNGRLLQIAQFKTYSSMATTACLIFSGAVLPRHVKRSLSITGRVRSNNRSGAG
jgi:hypothetical protein